VGPRAVLDAVVKRKIPSPSRELNPRNPIGIPVLTNSQFRVTPPFEVNIAYSTEIRTSNKQQKYINTVSIVNYKVWILLVPSGSWTNINITMFICIYTNNLVSIKNNMIPFIFRNNFFAVSINNAE
jgi:hypothetical protein